MKNTESNDPPVSIGNCLRIVTTPIDPDELLDSLLTRNKTKKEAI